MSDFAVQAPTHPHVASAATALADSSSGWSGDSRFLLARGLAKRRGLLATPQRKLAAALIASILVHIVVSSVVDVEPQAEKFAPITAKFMSLPPPPVAVPTPKPALKPKARPKAKPTARPVLATEDPAAIAVPEVVAEAPPEPTAVAQNTPAPTVEPVSVAEPAPPPAPEPAPAPPPPPARMPPKKIELAYTAFLGEQKFEVGPINLKFTHDNGHYNLKVTGRGRGLAALLYPGTFTGESEGRITADGLRPDKFIEERGNPDKRREIIFDHEKGVLRIPEKEPIPFEGSPQDPLTWIVQFYFSMPKGDQVTFSVGSTRRMDVYTLDRRGVEEIEAPTGPVESSSGARAMQTVKTEVWKGSRKPDVDGKPNGGAQFWLAPEWHYVPFRIKVVSAQGRSASFELVGVNTE